MNDPLTPLVVCGSCGDLTRYVDPEVEWFEAGYYRFTDRYTGEVIHECPEVIREARGFMNGLSLEPPGLEMS